MREQLLALFSQYGPMTLAIKQLTAEIYFQIGDALADGGLGFLHLTRTGGE
jgi:hypothetical protein